MDVEEIADRLYGLPLEEFVSARDQAARELRKEGRRDDADLLKALRKPTAAAGAANRLVQQHRLEVESFLGAAATLRDAQVAGKGDVGAAARREREALERLVGLGGAEVRPTLQAAAVDDDVARELLGGRLVREPEPPGFGTLLAHTPPPTTGPARASAPAPRHERARPQTPAAPRPERRDDSTARARLREAKERRAAAVSEERRARQRWTQSQRELEKAEAAVERAQQELDRVRGR